MKLNGLTLLETVVSLAILSVISLMASTAFSTAGNISMHADDIREDSENMAEQMAEMYFDYAVESDGISSLTISEDIKIDGEIIEVSGNEFDECRYIAVRPFENKTEDEISEGEVENEEESLED